MNHDPLKAVEQLAMQARNDDFTPPVDSVANVLRRIRRQDERSDNVLTWFAAASTAAALGMAIYITTLLYTMSDPMISLFQLFPDMLI